LAKPAQRINSLSFRLFVLATVWSLLALFAAGAYLEADYRVRAEDGHLAFLDLHLLNIVATTSVAEDGSLSSAGEGGDGRFMSLHSGWYWQVGPVEDGGPTMTSPSLAGAGLTLPDSADAPYDEEFRRVVVIPGPEGAQLRAVERLILLGNADAVYSFVVAGDTAIPERSVTDFRYRLIIVFALLGFGLVAITVVQVRLGLRPLRQVGRAVGQIREGRAERIEGRYPDEIVPLAMEINALIEFNAKIIERARMHVGNLAHALKTPLSVITNEARSTGGPLADKVVEQAGIMRDQVDYYLDRARIAAGVTAIGAVTEVGPAIAPLERAMRRIYSYREIDFEVTVSEGLRFHGERQDLEEMVGNLVDNAFKWARSQIRLEARALAGRPDRLEVVVEDDGPGLDAQAQQEAVRRGRRLDESKPGSGLGLSIVSELAELYDGQFELSEATKGGLRARLVLPAS
jgi:signal transduction histidine kinase